MLSQPAVLPIASARLVPATPMVVRSNKRFAAGVSAPAASAFRGVQLGGGIEPLALPRTLNGVREPRLLPPLMSAALSLMLLEALFDNLSPSVSRADGFGRWKGVLGGGISEDAISARSSEEIIRGVAFSVPHVISCFTATGPSSDGVGDGIVGNREKPLFDGECGRSDINQQFSAFRKKVACE